MRLTCLLVVIVALFTAGCGGNRAVPRPFPGASAPPDRADEPKPGSAAETPPPARDDRPRGAAPAPPVPAPSSLLGTALALRGTPYRNGGTNPEKGFDCSGFVQYVFARHGRTMPREVRDQFTVGTKVDRADVRPGDLVFFETVSRGPSHVGIAIGNNEFVHAPSSRGVVRVERYTVDYWARRWIGARRVGA